jgi:Protein of unknown function (DUF3455)
MPCPYEPESFQMRACSFLTLCIIVAALSGGRALAEVPAAIAAPGETTVVTFHAEGAQVYECKVGNDGKLAWAFREPIATLLLDGKTVGRHYAGPTWEHTDGSAIAAKAVGNAPGKTAGDIPWLKLEVTSHRGSGTLSSATTVQRINTQGGALSGSCEKAGAFHSAPYSADYVFLRKGP